MRLPTPSPRPDFDGDGTVGILDLLALLAELYRRPHGDCVVDPFDLAALLANWGTCP